MYKIFLDYSLPILIVVAFVNFIWAWIPTAVKPPDGSADLEWGHLDAGPEGVRRTVAAEMKPQIKTALSSRSDYSQK